ncbi:MAG: hypothetical protein O7D33_08135 [Chloroflexi bacterium]|nr:hypothetical protein [Chloroflexota bacterium]
MNLPQGLLSVTCLPNDFHVWFEFEQPAESASQHFVVIDKQYPHAVLLRK